MSPDRKRIAAVIGSQRASGEEEKTARALGEALVDGGYRVLTGGMGGVMRAASG